MVTIYEKEHITCEKLLDENLFYYESLLFGSFKNNALLFEVILNNQLEPKHHDYCLRGLDDHQMDYYEALYMNNVASLKRFCLYATAQLIDKSEFLRGMKLEDAIFSVARFVKLRIISPTICDCISDCHNCDDGFVMPTTEEIKVNQETLTLISDWMKDYNERLNKSISRNFAE